jgi:hypothetical protein
VIRIDHRTGDERELVGWRREERQKWRDAALAQRPQSDEPVRIPREQHMQLGKSSIGRSRKRCRMHEHICARAPDQRIPLGNEREVGRADFDRNHASSGPGFTLMRDHAARGLAVRLREWIPS